MDKRVRIFDTTLRDGEQTPGVHLTAEQKVAIAEQLEQFGVTTIEAGFPASSPSEQAAVARVARRVRGCEVAALARCTVGDVNAAAEAVAEAAAPVIHVFLGISEVHLCKKLRISRAQAIRAIERVVAHARRQGVEVQFSPEDATRAERAFLRQCVGVAVEAGATRINLPDTVGCALPSEYAAMIADIVQFVGPGVVVSAHCHNDLGMATANSIAAVQAGARQVEVTVNGIGERAGNAAAEEVAVAMALKGVGETGIDLRRIAALSRAVSEATGVPVQPNRAVVGANAFAHSSGIHQDGLLKDVSSYEFVPPALVGVEGHQFVLTARSGRSAIVHEAAALGYDLTPAQAEAVFEAFKRAAEECRGAVSREALARLVRQACAGPGGKALDHSTCA